MTRFTRIPESTFSELQVNAGVLLTNFNPSTGLLDMDSIITATTGGIKIDIVPTIEDFGADVDNCKKNSKELARKTETDITMSCTALNFNKATVKLALSAAEERSADNAIILRSDLKQSDFKSIWFVGDLSNGGFLAVKLIDALSTGGFTLQTSDKGKGKMNLTLKAHSSLSSQDTEPVELYIGEAEEESAFIRLDKSALNITVGGDTETITAITSPDDAEVTWTSTDTSACTVSNGIVTAVAAGTSVITAAITVDGVKYIDTAIVTVSAEE